MLKRFAAYYKPHKKLFLLDMAAAFLISMCDLFYPMITRNIINIYVPQKMLNHLLIWAAVILGIYLIKCGPYVFRAICAGICSTTCKNYPLRFLTKTRPALLCPV